MASTITRRSSDHSMAKAGDELLDASGAPALRAPLLLDWVPEFATISHGRAPTQLPPLPRGIVELSSRAFLCVSGAERESWLQGVQTADVRRILVEGAGPTLFLNSRGRALSDGLLWRRAGELLATVPADRLASLLQHLNGLLIMEDAELNPAPSLHAMRLSPGAAREILVALAPAQREQFAALRGTPGPLGFDLLVSDDLCSALLAAIPERPDPLALEQHRLALGVPLWAQDFDADSTPLEAGLDGQLAFDKGCYVGQEVIAMATFRGRVPWNLVRLEVEGTAPAVGSALDSARGAKGRVTSSVALGQRALLLGIVHRESIEPGTPIPLADGRSATVLGLPYGSRPGAGQRG